MITAPQSMFTFVNLTKVIFYCKSNLHIACLYLAGIATIAISLLTVVGEKLFYARAQIRPVWKTAAGPRFVRQIFFFSSTSFSVLFSWLSPSSFALWIDVGFWEQAIHCEWKKIASNLIQSNFFQQHLTTFTFIHLPDSHDRFYWEAVILRTGKKGSTENRQNIFYRIF